MRERERKRWMECVDVADSAGTLPFPSLSLSFLPLTHTSTAESCLWAEPLYCRQRAAANTRAR